MKAIIDARSRMSFEKIYSIPLFERILRQFNELKADVEAVIVIAPGVDSGKLLSKCFLKRYKIRHRFLQSSDHLQIIIPLVIQDKEKLILLAGDGIYDERIISALISSVKPILICDKDRKVPLAACITIEQIQRLTKSTVPIAETLKAISETGSPEPFEIQSMNNYVRFLRRNVIPLITRLESAKDIRELENTMYTNTFKGTMEFIAVYGYRIPVRELTRIFAMTPITPNHITAAALICSFGAIPMLAFGWLWTGLLMAAGFIIFDSLDGKLARMTIRLSKAADRFDHLTSLPTRTAWYFALGWSLSDGDLTTRIGLATMVLTSIPYLDKLIGVIFNAKFGRSPLDFTSFDAKVHLFTVRRNDIFFLIIALGFGFISTGYFITTVWAVLTWLWHFYRLVWFLVNPGAKRD